MRPAPVPTAAVVIDVRFHRSVFVQPSSGTVRRGPLQATPMFRVGFGYDVHRLVKERPLILGGVAVPHPFGLLGHSDADVLVHAVMDALLGAVGKGDIGKHFPDSDPSFKDQRSMVLLQRVMDWVRLDGYAVNNVDATVVAQKPKLAPYLNAMRDNLARVLEAPAASINLKATTTERLGFCGRGEGMEAFAVVSLVKSDASE